jgi:hypothetical protein
MEGERNMFRYYPGWYYQTPIYFRIQGAPMSVAAALQPPMLNFIPAPNATTSFMLHYVPTFGKWLTDGTQDGLVFDGVNGFEAYAIWGAVAMALEKLEQDSSFAQRKQEEQKKRIQAMAVDRMAGQAERVADVTGDVDIWPWGGH